MASSTRQDTSLLYSQICPESPLCILCFILRPPLSRVARLAQGGEVDGRRLFKRANFRRFAVSPPIAALVRVSVCVSVCLSVCVSHPSGEIRWICEKCMTGRARGPPGAMVRSRRESANQRTSEPANQRTSESANQRISESANRRIGESANRRIGVAKKRRENSERRAP